MELIEITLLAFFTDTSCCTDHARIFCIRHIWQFFYGLLLASAILGLLMLLFPYLSLEYQVLILAMIFVFSVLIGCVYLGKNPLTNDQPFLNKRGTELV